MRKCRYTRLKYYQYEFQVSGPDYQVLGPDLQVLKPVHMLDHSQNFATLNSEESNQIMESSSSSTLDDTTLGLI